MQNPCRAAAVLAVALPLVFAGCRSQPGPPPDVAAQTAELSLASTAFGAGAAIPAKYTCDGENVSPPLGWSGAPDGVRSFAIIMEDPDAPLGTFTHWVIFNLPAGSAGLPEGVTNADRLENGAVQGENSFGKLGYGGPCPPRGSEHHYVFKLYALDTSLTTNVGATAKQVYAAMSGHVLGYGELTGTCAR